MLNKKTLTISQPCAVLGAGDLVSHLIADDRSIERQYRFNLFRLDHESGQPNAWFRSTDLRDLVKVCQVLAFAIADEGGIGPELHSELIRLNAELDRLTKDWSDTSDG